MTYSALLKQGIFWRDIVLSQAQKCAWILLRADLSWRVKCMNVLSIIKAGFCNTHYTFLWLHSKGNYTPAQIYNHSTMPLESYSKYLIYRRKYNKLYIYATGIH